MPTYAQLNQRHPCAKPDRDALFRALYEGGDRLEALYPKLLPKRLRESAEHYGMRLKEAEYRNYLGPIIDYFRSMLFLSRPVLKAKAPEAEEATADPGPYWVSFREDCDGGGTDIDEFCSRSLTDAMSGKTAWTRLHIPTDGGDAPTDLAEFEKRGLGDAWLERLEPNEVLDWETDEADRLRWARVHETEFPRNPYGTQDATVIETWEILTPEFVETFRIQYKATEPPKPDTDIPRVARTPNRFGAVPIVCLDLPEALWIANRLASPQLALLRKVSALAWSLAATAYAMPVVKVKDPDDYKAQRSGAGYEILLQQDDDYSWAAPPSEHFAALATEITASKDEVFRIAHQMAMGVSNNAAAVGRSAESKASDYEITRVVLAAYSRAVREYLERILDLVSKARGEDYEWSVEGLDDFAAFDIGAFLSQLGLLDKVGGIPSKTFAIQWKKRVSEALLKDVDEETKATIRKEIEAGTVDPVQQAQEERELALGMFGDRGAPADTPPSGGAKRPRKSPPKPPA